MTHERRGIKDTRFVAEALACSMLASRQPVVGCDACNELTEQQWMTDPSCIMHHASSSRAQGHCVRIIIHSEFTVSQDDECLSGR